MLNPVLTPEVAAQLQSLVKPTAQSVAATPEPVLPAEAPPAPESPSATPPPTPSLTEVETAAPSSGVAAPSLEATPGPAPVPEEPPSLSATEGVSQPLTLEGVLGPDLYARLQQQAFGETMTPGKALALGAIGYSRPDLVPTLMAQEERKAEGARDLLAAISSQVNYFNRTIEQQRGAEIRADKATERAQLVAMAATARQVTAKAHEWGITNLPPEPPDLQGKANWVAEQGSRVASEGFARQAAAKVYAEMEAAAKAGTLRGDMAQQFRDRMEVAGVPPALVMKYGGAYEQRLQQLANEQATMAAWKVRVLAEETNSLRAKVGNEEERLALARKALEQGDRRIALGHSVAINQALTALQTSREGLNQILLSQRLENQPSEVLDQTMGRLQELDSRISRLGAHAMELSVAASGPLLDMMTGQRDIEEARQAVLERVTSAVQADPYLTELVNAHMRRLTGRAENAVIGPAQVQMFLKANTQSKLYQDYYNMVISSVTAGRTDEEIQQIKDALTRVLSAPTGGAGAP